MPVILKYVLHEIERLPPVAVSIAANGVPVEFRMRQGQHKITHMAIPCFRVTPISLRQPHGIQHMPRPRIISGQREFQQVRAVQAKTVKLPLQLPQIAASRLDIVRRIRPIGTAHLLRRLRHHLHQPVSAERRLCVGTKTRLLVNHCGQQPPIPPDCRRLPFDYRVEGRYDTVFQFIILGIAQ